MSTSNLEKTDPFSAALYETMKQVDAAVREMELYEFRYGLDNLRPKPGGWESVPLETPDEILRRVHDAGFYRSIQIKPRVGDQIVLDENIVRLTNTLLAGLGRGTYTPEWVREHFYFDVRGFYFLTRTLYFTPEVLAHLGGKPFRQFENKQRDLERCQDIGYKMFGAANAELDACFIDAVKRLIAAKGTPIVLALAGPTAAGKTEIVERLRDELERSGKRATSIEMDNFLTDRDRREQLGIFSQGQAAIHFELFKTCLAEITQGRKTTTPRYDFIGATSSHDLDGRLKPGATPVEVDPADIIFIEGNFPFLLAPVVPLIGIKVVYLTDDPVRLKRKWRRDIDYRKKYEPTYFRNRYFKDQYLMAESVYRPQMQTCDLVVDTTGAALWATAETAALLDR